MNKIKKYIIIFTLLAAFCPLLASAKSFVAHLYYDSKTKNLYFDKTQTEQVSFDKKLFTSQVDFLQGIEGVPGGTFAIILYDTSDSEIGRLSFNAPPKGSFDVAIPFFPFSKTIKIINNKTQKEILSSDLSKFSSCNANGICELEKGESVEGCLVDCGTSKVTYSEETKKILEKNKGIVKDPDTGEILLQDKSFSGSSQSTAPSFTGEGSSGVQSQPSAGQSTPSAVTSTSSAGQNPILLAIAAIALVALAGFFVYKKFFKK